MRIALTVWKERISPLFEGARMLLVADIASGTVIARRYLPLRPEAIHCRAVRLAELGIDTLVCGAITRAQETLLQAHHIHVLADVTGRAEVALAALLAGCPIVQGDPDGPPLPGKES